MNRNEAREIYKEIKILYPFFNKDNDETQAKLWLDRLELGDYALTKTKLLDYSLASTYPPTLADIIAKKYVPVNTEVTDIEAMEEAVRLEKNDPELRVKREESLKRFEEKLKELRKIGR